MFDPKAISENLRTSAISRWYQMANLANASIEKNRVVENVKICQFIQDEQDLMVDLDYRFMPIAFQQFTSP